MTVRSETSMNNRPKITKKRLNTCIRTQFSYLSSTYSILISIRFSHHYSRLESAFIRRNDGFVPHPLRVLLFSVNPRACACDSRLSPLPLFPAGVCVCRCRPCVERSVQWPTGAASWEEYVIIIELTFLSLSLSSSYCDSVLSLLISRLRQLYPRCHGYTHVRLVPLHYS